MKVKQDGTEIYWDCVGCKMMHAVPIRRPDSDHNWSFNGDFESPTLSPSVHARWPVNQVCHFFIVAGKVQFLSDCTHKLAGQTVEMPECEV
jgi:hypothetical protein